MNDTRATPPRRWFRFGLRTIFVVLAASSVGYLLFVLITAAKRNSDVTEVRHNLLLIGMTLSSYESMQGCFPPQVLLAPNGEAYQGWRGIILPLTEKEPLPLDPGMAWNSAKNFEVAKLPNRIYCGLGNPANETHVVAVTGAGHFFEGMQKRMEKHITRDPSRVIVAIEVLDSGIGWAEPKDWTEEEFANRFRGHNVGQQKRGFYALMADGSVQLIEYSRNLAEVLTMFRIADGPG